MTLTCIFVRIGTGFMGIIRILGLGIGNWIVVLTVGVVRLITPCAHPAGVLPPVLVEGHIMPVVGFLLGRMENLVPDAIIGNSDVYSQPVLGPSLPPVDGRDGDESWASENS